MKKMGQLVRYEDLKEFPLLTLKGDGKGPITVVTAGIHGCEYAPVNALYELYGQLDVEKIKGCIIFIPIVDLQGFEARNMFVCPVDNKNINRVFPGKEKGTYSEKLIFNIFNRYIKQADYYIDLHCADLIEDMIPFIEIHESGNTEVDLKSRIMAEHYGIEDITIKRLQGEVNDKGQSYSAAAEAGIPSILANAGKIRERSGDQIHIKGLQNLLKYTGNMEGRAKKPDRRVFYKPPVHIRSREKGLFSSPVQVGNYIKEEEVVGKVLDYEGNQLYTVKAPVSGKILLKNAAAAVNKGSLLLEILVEM